MGDVRGPTLEDARRYVLAVVAAQIDAARALPRRKVMEQGVMRSPRPHESFTREHVAAIRSAGGTRTDALDYARHAGFTDAQLVMFESDLDSYGEWSGG